MRLLLMTLSAFGLAVMAGLLLGGGVLLLVVPSDTVPTEVAIADEAGGIVIVPVPSPVRPTPTPLADFYDGDLVVAPVPTRGPWLTTSSFSSDLMLLTLDTDPLVKLLRYTMPLDEPTSGSLEMELGFATGLQVQIAGTWYDCEVTTAGLQPVGWAIAELTPDLYALPEVPTRCKECGR